MTKPVASRECDAGCDPAWRTIARVVRKNHRALIAAAVPFAGPGTCAHDIVQEALITAHDCFSELKDPNKPLPWLWSIVVNTGREIARKRTRRREKLILWALKQEPAQAEKSPSVGDELARLALERAVEELPELQRKALKLRVFEDMTIKQIAGEISRAPGTVKATLYRARAALRKTLDAE